MLLHVVTKTNYGLAYARDVKSSFETFYDLKINLVIYILVKLLFDFERHYNWDCANLEPISPRRKNSFEPPCIKV